VAQHAADLVPPGESRNGGSASLGDDREHEEEWYQAAHGMPVAGDGPMCPSRIEALEKLE
jgi:hypothetical protein